MYILQQIVLAALAVRLVAGAPTPLREALDRRVPNNADAAFLINERVDKIKRVPTRDADDNYIIPSSDADDNYIIDDHAENIRHSPTKDADDNYIIH
ncbi:MAG: hypothetical protein LQ352_006514 [Teloschistes flavicans]|nr:MAG: hypothetical protein LQ352_006514 [Teloschistes flavicans]